MVRGLFFVSFTDRQGCRREAEFLKPGDSEKTGSPLRRHLSRTCVETGVPYVGALAVSALSQCKKIRISLANPGKEWYNNSTDTGRKGDRMKIASILSHVDHTDLKQTATWENIRALCEDGLRYHTASVCIPPVYVARAAEYLGGRLPVCTVIGFPNGYGTTAAKVFETADAVKNGADEIDMVINIGWLRAREYEAVLREIRAVRAACPGKILKVIVETCLLTEQEKIRMCGIVGDSGADYIKTSTGFSSGGATPEDIALFAGHRPAHLKIKAAGGIRSFADAERYLSLGADRLGTSALVRLAKEAEA